jgi:hypothetical protein
MHSVDPSRQLRHCRLPRWLPVTQQPALRMWCTVQCEHKCTFRRCLFSCNFEADWDMRRRVRQTCAHGKAQVVAGAYTPNGHLRASYCATRVFEIRFCWLLRTVKHNLEKSDRFTAFGEYVAKRVRDLSNSRLKSIVEDKINTILFDTEVEVRNVQTSVTIHLDSEHFPTSHSCT